MTCVMSSEMYKRLLYEIGICIQNERYETSVCLQSERYETHMYRERKIRNCLCSSTEVLFFFKNVKHNRLKDTKLYYVQLFAKKNTYIYWGLEERSVNYEMTSRGILQV